MNVIEELVQINGAWSTYSDATPNPPLANQPPTAAFSVTLTGENTWSFDGQASSDNDGTVIGARWDFGDSSTTVAGFTATHTYATPGTFTVTLTVTDNKGATGSVAHTVTVTNPLAFVLGTTKPSASNTGAGIIRPYPTTHVYTDVTLTGTQSLTDTIVHGRVICKGSSNTVENCVIIGTDGSDYGASGGATGGDVWFVDCTGASGQANVRFCTIYGRVATYKINGIGSRNYYAYRCDVSQTVDAFSGYPKTAGGSANIRIEGCYGHELQYNSPDPNHPSNCTHNDVFQIQGGTGINVKGCFLNGSWSQTVNTGNLPGSYIQLAAIMLNANVGTATATLDSNWFDGGQDTVNGGGASTGNFTITNNRFGRTYTLKPLVLDAATTRTVSNNTFEDDGSSVGVTNG